MKYRNILRRFQSVDTKMGEHNLRQAFPLTGVEQISPFILLHHFDFIIEPGDFSFNIAPHPHRGFCPVTFMFEGSVEHKDSFGNHKVIKGGEVQWINAGRGIIHSEKASKEMVECGGRYQGIQLWINLPSIDKMKPASYQPIDSSMMTIIKKKGVALRLVSGEFEGQKGAANSKNITIMATMDEKTSYTFELPSDYNTIVYVLEGEIIINDEERFNENEVLWFKNEEEKILIQTNKFSKLLILSGQPIDEPKVAYGPYVMNTQTEIMEAMRDYKDGKMGYL